ncbi:MAG: phage major capsid protein [Planctomycetaceae bacterium]|nr:phage major capsid protein [Planctomycetaceae bacterium]
MNVTPQLRLYLKKRHGLTDAFDLMDESILDFVDDLGSAFDKAHFNAFCKAAKRMKSVLDDEPEHEESLEDMELQLKRKLEKQFTDPNQFVRKDMSDGNRLMAMATETRQRYADETNDDTAPSIRVKSVGESHYSTKRAVLSHSRWGTPIHPIKNGAVSPDPVESLSEWETAKLGAWLKFKAARAGLCSMNEHDRNVFNELVEKDTFVGEVDGKLFRTTNTKALLDDNTSGGENLVPEWFDRSTITFPLLHSEILPHVDVVDMPRGSTVETVSVGNPTLTWGTAEGSAQTLFNTASLIARITADVTPVAIYLQVGRDLLSDSLPNIGNEIAMNVAQRHAAELDRVIVSGATGSGEIQGILNASGTTDITPSNPTTGAVTFNDLLDLMFGIEKSYRIPSYAPRYIMSDQRYKSHRAVVTGVTGDARPLHGMSVQSYELLEAPVSIENNLTHNYGIFGAMKKYRLWRRAGFQIGWEMGGDTLVRSNQVLFHARGRYGGKVVDANAFAVVDAWASAV